MSHKFLPKVAYTKYNTTYAFLVQHIQVTHTIKIIIFYTRQLPIYDIYNNRLRSPCFFNIKYYIKYIKLSYPSDLFYYCALHHGVSKHYSPEHNRIILKRFLKLHWHYVFEKLENDSKPLSLLIWYNTNAPWGTKSAVQTNRYQHHFFIQTPML